MGLFGVIPPPPPPPPQKKKKKKWQKVCGCVCLNKRGSLSGQRTRVKRAVRVWLRDIAVLYPSWQLGTCNRREDADLGDRNKVTGAKVKGQRSGFVWATSGALDGGGGVPMSPVDFKKWQCRMALSLTFPTVTCRIQMKTMSHVAISFIPLSHVARPDVACRIWEMPMSPRRF